MRKEHKNRALAITRLSRVMAENQSGTERQEQNTELYIQVKNWELVGLVSDENVSGGSDPFTRPELGPWLTDPDKIDKYDIIVAAKLDRLSRSTKYFAKLVEWAKENDKRIVCLDVGGEEVDFNGRVGSLIGFIISWLAEGELDAITSRITDNRHWLRANGYWDGRTIVYGYEPACDCHGYVKLPGQKTPDGCPDPKHYVLTVIPARQKVVNEIMQRILDGEAMNAIARDLNERGERTADGHLWSQTTISRIVHNPAIAGYATYRPIIGKNDHGKAVYSQTPEILTNPDTDDPVKLRGNPAVVGYELYHAVQDKLFDKATHAPGSKNRWDTHMLTGVIECPCGMALYAANGDGPGSINPTKVYKRVNRGGELDELYRNCPHGTVDMIEVERAVSAWITDHSYPQMKRVKARNTKLETELKRYEGRLAKLQTDRKKFGRAEFESRQATLQNKIYELEDQIRDLPPAYEWKPTGKTLAKMWARWDVKKRHDFLVSNGFKVIAHRAYRDRATGELARCPVCGEDATNKMGTCAVPNAVKRGDPRFPCKSEYRRRKHQNRLAVRAGNPVPWFYPRPLHIEVIPGPNFGIARD